MPSTSRAQRRAMAIAEHHPGELYARNKGLLSMSHKQLHEFASTPEAGLPKRNRMAKSKRSMRDRATAASPPMTTPEIRQGYRVLK